ncbi:MAG: cyclic nucleotide-binding domain-containing protein [bacterium]
MVEKYKITKQEEVYNLLKTKRNFSYMSETLLRRLISEMKVVRFTKKTLLLKQDTENRFIYIIIKGAVTVYVYKKPLYTLRRTGDVFGELSFATKSPSTASIVAEEGLGVMAISFNYLKKLNDIEFGFWLCHVLGEKLVRTSKLKSIRTAENMDELETETGGETLEPGEMPDGEPAADTVSTAEPDTDGEQPAEADIEIEDVLSDGEDNGEAVTGEDGGEAVAEESWETPPDIEEIPLG